LDNATGSSRDAASVLFDLPGYRVLEAVDLPGGGREVVIEAGRDGGRLPGLRCAFGSGASTHEAAAAGRAGRRPDRGGAGQVSLRLPGAGLSPAHIRAGHRSGPGTGSGQHPAARAGPGRGHRPRPSRLPRCGRARPGLVDRDGRGQRRRAATGQPRHPHRAPARDRRAPLPLDALLPRSRWDLAAVRALDEHHRGCRHRAGAGGGRRAGQQRRRRLAGGPVRHLAGGSRGGRDRPVGGVPPRVARAAAASGGQRRHASPGQARQRRPHPGPAAGHPPAQGAPRPAGRPVLDQPAIAAARGRHPVPGRSGPAQGDVRRRRPHRRNRSHLGGQGTAAPAPAGQRPRRSGRTAGAVRRGGHGHGDTGDRPARRHQHRLVAGRRSPHRDRRDQRPHRSREHRHQEHQAQVTAPFPKVPAGRGPVLRDPTSIGSPASGPVVVSDTPTAGSATSRRWWSCSRTGSPRSTRSPGRRGRSRTAGSGSWCHPRHRPHAPATW
jgi:hypothetical protein